MRTRAANSGTSANSRHVRQRIIYTPNFNKDEKLRFIVKGGQRIGPKKTYIDGWISVWTSNRLKFSPTFM